MTFHRASFGSTAEWYRFRQISYGLSMSHLA